MVTGTGGGAVALDMRGLDLSALYFGSVLDQSSTAVDVYEGSGFTAHFLGHDVAYNALGQPAAGTITTISEDYLGQTTFSITGMNTSASQFYGWVAADDNATALTTIFSGNDTLTGTVFDDYLIGYGGHDYLNGGGGADTLLGGDGNDHLYGNAQTAVAGSIDGADSLSGGDGSDYLQGNAGNDTLDGGNGSDRINGGADDDSIIGGDGNDTINGNTGNDRIEGDDGNDSLRGGQGNDTIDGGTGNDVISGDKGQDVMTGGAGADTFKFAAGDAAIVNGATDVITDFAHGTDGIALGFTVSGVIAGGTQSTEASAQTAAQGLLGDGHHVVATQVGADTYLFWSGTAGATIDSAVELKGVTASTLLVSDFI